MVIKNRKFYEICTGLNAEFVKRGTITVKSLKTGGAYFHPENVVSENDREQIEVEVQRKFVIN